MTDYLRLWKTDPARVEQWMARNDIDARKIGRRLFHSYLRQVLEDNLFHADLHPGNIFLLRENRIVLLDFGSVGSNEGDLLRKYDMFLEALSTGKYAKAIDVFLLIMPELPANNLAQVKEELQRFLLDIDGLAKDADDGRGNFSQFFYLSLSIFFVPASKGVLSQIEA